ncbi:hypothetical protein ASH00_15620 [Arthrobacter sp. Soil782]|uniref:DUF4386 domain-containing protein n=1 Tax=Arthrobacter sp. Soil782 TaxID=1736410 RepID=UPI0006FDB556|nr:DUF4386 domain-containing protein [Arthrobacter sp. Soil782]KRF03447.1 hypothetical protein ASH00_15620 [Arthrobacter sp. Soil782]
MLLLLDIQHYGTLAAQAFFGLWLAPLGYLVIKSKLFPKALGIVLILATASYLIDVALAFLLPQSQRKFIATSVLCPPSEKSGWSCTCSSSVSALRARRTGCQRK